MAKPGLVAKRFVTGILLLSAGPAYETGLLSIFVKKGPAGYVNLLQEYRY